MNSSEKIDYMLNQIREKARISPKGFLPIRVASLLYYDEATGMVDEDAVLFSASEQLTVLRKLQDDGLIHLWDFDADKRVALVVLDELDITTDKSPYETVAEPEFLETTTIGGELILNIRTGKIKYNGVHAELNPNSQEFNALSSMMKSPDGLLSYTDFLGEKYQKTKQMDMAKIINNIKIVLKILPASKTSQKDIFINKKNLGYILEKK